MTIIIALINEFIQIELKLEKEKKDSIDYVD